MCSVFGKSNRLAKFKESLVIFFVTGPVEDDGERHADEARQDVDDGQAGDDLVQRGAQVLVAGHAQDHHEVGGDGHGRDQACNNNNVDRTGKVAIAPLRLREEWYERNASGSWMIQTNFFRLTKNCDLPKEGDVVEAWLVPLLLVLHKINARVVVVGKCLVPQAHQFGPIEGLHLLARRVVWPLLKKAELGPSAAPHGPGNSFFAVSRRDPSERRHSSFAAIVIS